MEITDVVLIPVLIGFVDALKGYGVEKRWLPVVSIVLGVGGSVLYLYPEDWKLGVLAGVIVGLSASGLYSGGKVMVESRREV